ncbi:FAD-dependent oxidoreductase OS=Streptomyces rutgersensis OX=53451 GN=F0345_28500 PE=4 SV=1 [Streptomyces diastaticus subsp. diastaticus]
MPSQAGETYPDAGHVVEYLTDYEKRYNLPVQHGARVGAVHRDGERLLLEADWAPGGPARGHQRHRHLVAALPPRCPRPRPLHRTPVPHGELPLPADFAGQRVIVVGGGNSGAQITADLALDGSVHVTWVTQRPPRFLPDDIDGRALFDVATARRRALDAGLADTGGLASLGDIVAVPPVRAARGAGLLTAKPMFSRLTASGVRWDDGSHTGADAIVWCTGFRPALSISLR